MKGAAAGQVLPAANDRIDVMLGSSSSPRQSTGRGDELSALMRQCVIPLYAIRSRRKGYEVSTMKALMDMAGLNGGPVRPPLVNVTSEEVHELQAILQSWQPYL